MFFYTYVLLSLKDNQFYIGYSSNLKQRVKNHFAGKNTSTKPRLPFKLIYFEGHVSKIDAMRREKYFKTEKGKSSLRQMIRESLKNEKV